MKPNPCIFLDTSLSLTPTSNPLPSLADSSKRSLMPIPSSPPHHHHPGPSADSSLVSSLSILFSVAANSNLKKKSVHLIISWKHFKYFKDFPLFCSVWPLPASARSTPASISLPTSLAFWPSHAALLASAVPSAWNGHDLLHQLCCSQSICTPCGSLRGSGPLPSFLRAPCASFSWHLMWLSLYSH